MSDLMTQFESFLTTHSAFSLGVAWLASCTLMGLLIYLCLIAVVSLYLFFNKPLEKMKQREPYFPEAESTPLDEAWTLKTVVSGSISVPEGTAVDGEEITIDGETWYLGIWLYNDSRTRCMVPFEYRNTESEIIKEI